MASNYQIKTNLSGRNILIVEGVINIDLTEEIKTEDFDIIWIMDTKQTHAELSYQLQLMSPFHSLKCHLKPRFLETSLKNRVLGLSTVVDGYVDSIDDKLLNELSNDIYEKLAYIETFDIAEVTKSNYIYFLKLCKYAISRGMNTFTMSLDKAYAIGHTALFVAKQNNLLSNMRAEFIHFNHILMDLGYAIKTKFLERIHICPKCKNTHLFYMEACPKCNSSNLQEEPVLHHFRCANISPESSYLYDGELRCPKCHHFLRHIGVDYDRPSNVYTCKECNHNFLHTKMKVYCHACRKSMRPSDLIPTDLYLYEFTPDGILALSSNDALVAISKDLWAGYSNFTSFISQIRLFSYSKDKNEAIFINRFKVDGPNVNKETIISIVSDIQKRYHYNNLSYNGNNIFMATKAPADMSDTLKRLMEEEYLETMKIIDLKYPGIVLSEPNYLNQNEGEKIEAFIKRISKDN
ncbi:MAG: hypothetical protein J6Q34_00375 [Bacteroidales bacterium]|nr:hypothetical protein [Bacteroidales bacterium]